MGFPTVFIFKWAVDKAKICIGLYDKGLCQSVDERQKGPGVPIVFQVSGT